MTDERLVVRCQLGERDAFAELVRAWHDPIWSYVRRMLPPAVTDDVAQEVWVAVLRGLPRLRDPARFTPWLFTIARRAVTNRLREEYARPEEPLSDVASPDAVAEVLDRTELAGALSALPPREREILILFYLQDLSLETCAEICAVPIGTVKSRLNRARRLLRDALVQKGYSR
nr:sigma-70 family RNA polymerase sigma factor [Dactylosporangium thailandense]